LKRIIIVGGGYAGTALARVLDDVAEIRLVEPRDRFVHNVAAIRAVTDPSLLKYMQVPYDHLLRRGSIVQDRVIAMDEKGVRLEGGVEIAGDIIVAATGSTYAKPFKPGLSVAPFDDDCRAAHAQLLSSKRIAIVGAGPVGVELAGEILSAFPDKQVTLISDAPVLLAGFSPKLSARLAEQLQVLGVTLRLGERVESLAALDRPFPGPLRIAGETLDADIVFPAIGARPTSPPMADALLAPSGRLKVDPWLRAAGGHTVFALGDAAETGDPMTTAGVVRQKQWLAKTLKAMLEGRAVEDLPPYKPWSVHLMVTPLGSKAGASLLPLFGRGLVVGPRITASLKGKDLFIPRCHQGLGYPAPVFQRSA
jgi:apoptosis-inducing factor 2